MTVLRATIRGGLAELRAERDRRRAPRRDIVLERQTGADSFEAVEGPFSRYERRLDLRRRHADGDVTTRPHEPRDGEGTARRHRVGQQASRQQSSTAGQSDRSDEAGQRAKAVENPLNANTPAEDPCNERDGWELRETIDYRLAVPVWSWLFHLPVRRALARRQAEHGYWWAPPDRLDARRAAMLGLLCALQVVDGYLGTVLTQTLTFAADEFGHGNTAQGVVLAAVRLGVLIALVTVTLADRHGRRRLLLSAGVGSCAFTVLGAMSPNLWFLGGSQLVARGLSTAMGILIVILATEEMPARSRAWAMSVLVLCAGLGAGMAVGVLSLAERHVGAWRIVYLVPIAGVWLIAWTRTRLHESSRFSNAASTRSDSAATERRHQSETTTTDRAEARDPARQPEPGRSEPDNATGQEAHRRRMGLPRPVVGLGDLSSPSEEAQRRRERLMLLAASAFLLAMFAAPASGLRNDFLKDEREFSAAAITVFTLATNTPTGIGVFAGGYLADRRGRRPVGAAGLVLGSVLTTLAFFCDGLALWLLSLSGALLGAMAVPALAVYGPELFGTHRRGRSNGLITVVGVSGSALGLLTAGRLSDMLDGRVGPPLALLCAGPLAVAVLVLWKFPETVGQELEALNPEDR